MDAFAEAKLFAKWKSVRLSTELGRERATIKGARPRPESGLPRNKAPATSGRAAGRLGAAIPAPTPRTPATSGQPLPPSPDSGPDPGYLGTGAERSGGPDPGYLGTRVPLVWRSSPQTPLGETGLKPSSFLVEALARKL